MTKYRAVAATNTPPRDRLRTIHRENAGGIVQANGDGRRPDPRRVESGSPEALSSTHQRYLRERGVAPAVAVARGYQTIPSPATLRRPEHGFPAKQTKGMKGPVLAIPLWTAAGAPAHTQVRLPRSRSDRKFLVPNESPNVVDVHPDCYESAVYRDRTAPLYIPEGVTRGDALWGLGLPAASITGVYNWRGRDETGWSDVIADLELVPVEGRSVILAPDGDVASNPGVREATRRLAHWLERRGAAEVLVLACPAELGAKAGLDDLIGTRLSSRVSTNEIRAELDALARPVHEIIGRGAQLSVVVDNEVEPEDVTYLWDPYVPNGKLSIVDGQPGQGKTFALLNLAAALSRGGELPGGPAGEPVALGQPGKTVFFSMEDDPADTLVPRYNALGGRAGHLVMPRGFADPAAGGFVLRDPAHLASLEALIEEHAPRLVVFDPLLGYMGPGTDVHRSNETRPILSALGELASRRRVAIVGIRHTRKARDGTARDAGLGSIDFTAAARSVLIIGRHPEREDGSVLAHSKSSTTRAGASLEVEIDDGHLEWLGTSALRADDLVLAPKQRGPTSSRRGEAAEWLEALLAESPGVPAREVRRRADERGISASTLDRAAHELGVDTGKRGSRLSVWRLKL